MLHIVYGNKTLAKIKKVLVYVRSDAGSSELGELKRTRNFPGPQFGDSHCLWELIMKWHF